MNEDDVIQDPDPWTKDCDVGSEHLIVCVVRLFVKSLLQVQLQKYKLAFVVEFFSPRGCQITIALWEFEIVLASQRTC